MFFAYLGVVFLFVSLVLAVRVLVSTWTIQTLPRYRFVTIVRQSPGSTALQHLDKESNACAAAFYTALELFASWMFYSLVFGHFSRTATFFGLVVAAGCIHGFTLCAFRKWRAAFRPIQLD